jgi:type II secretory pathway pseudopilin PulG
VKHGEKPKRSASVRRRCFTLFEILIVSLLIVVVAALVGPRVSSVPKRYVVESNLSRLRQVINETSTRARASGRGLILALDVDASSFSVTALEQTLAREWVPPAGGSQEQPGHSMGFIEVKSSYELGKEFTWLPDNDAFNADGKLLYYFHPNGEAGGPTLDFELKGRRFQLDVDRLSATPLIQELQ